jgi:hypothetical protein
MEHWRIQLETKVTVLDHHVIQNHCTTILNGNAHPVHQATFLTIGREHYWLIGCALSIKLTEDKDRYHRGVNG